MADAIVRALWRMNVSRKHLLEWETAADAEKRAGTTRAAFWRAMGPSAVVAVVAARCSATLGDGPPSRGRGAARGALARRPGNRLVVLEADPAARGRAADISSGARAPTDGAQDVAVLRDLRRRAWPQPGARQLPGRPGRSRRVAHLADQHRAAAALLRHRLRPGLHDRGRPDRRAARDPLGDDRARALPRALTTTGTTSRRSSR